MLRNLSRSLKTDTATGTKAIKPVAVVRDLEVWVHSELSLKQHAWRSADSSKRVSTSKYQLKQRYNVSSSQQNLR